MIIDRTFTGGAQMRRYATGDVCPRCGKRGVSLRNFGMDFFCHSYVRMAPGFTNSPGFFAEGGCSLA
jgi:hypothetical protein